MNMNEYYKIILFVILSGICVVGNTVVAAIWLIWAHKNPEANKLVNTTKFVLLSCGTSELIAIVCILKLLMA